MSLNTSNIVRPVSGAIIRTGNLGSSTDSIIAARSIIRAGTSYNNPYNTPSSIARNAQLIGTYNPAFNTVVGGTLQATNPGLVGGVFNNDAAVAHRSFDIHRNIFGTILNDRNPVLTYNNNRIRRFANPSFANPNVGSSSFVDPRFRDPRFRDPRFADPRFADPRFADPRYGGQYNSLYPGAYPYSPYVNPYNPGIVPPVSLGCDPYTDCSARYDNHYDCHNCVINQGGGENCAAQVCRNKI